MTAMWNLNGSDIQKAKEQLEARRTTLKAEYEEAVKRIDAELADIETVERVAVSFVSGQKGGEPSAKGHSKPEKAEDDSSAFDGGTEMKSSTDSEKSSENGSDSHDKPPAEQKGTRWRRRAGAAAAPGRPKPPIKRLGARPWAAESSSLGETAPIIGLRAKTRLGRCRDPQRRLHGGVERAQKPRTVLLPQRRRSAAPHPKFTQMTRELAASERAPDIGLR